jgi:hypothetical protein
LKAVDSLKQGMSGQRSQIIREKKEKEKIAQINT